MAKERVTYGILFISSSQYSKMTVLHLVCLQSYSLLAASSNIKMLYISEFI